LISTLRGKPMLILLRLRFLNLSGYFIKLNTICPQNVFLHYIMRLLSYCNFIWDSSNATNQPRIYLPQKRAVRAISKADYKPSTIPLFANLKILDVFNISSLSKKVLSCTYIIMMLYLFLLLKSFKLEIRFINI